MGGATGVVFGPPKSGEFGDGSLAIAVSARAVALAFTIKLLAGGEATGILNFSQEPGDQDETQAIKVQEGLGFGEKG